MGGMGIKGIEPILERKEWERLEKKPIFWAQSWKGKD